VASEVLPTSDPLPRSVARPAGVLSYVDEGPRDGYPLVLVHGIPGSVRDFRYLAPQLSARVRCIRVDLPGFGDSAPRDDAIDSLTGRASAVVELADHLELERFAVLGHSMGGGTALVLAAEQGRRVSHLVLLASVALSLHRGLGLQPWIFRFLARGLRLPIVGQRLTRHVRDEYRRRRFPGVDELDDIALARQLRAAAATDFARLRRAVDSALPPTLIAYSRDDHMVEAWISEELAHALPAAMVLAFEDGGHNLQKTRARELGLAIQARLGLT
jgi:pimeloyl-ACP methyl ester carboxylesterase